MSRDTPTQVLQVSLPEDLARELERRVANAEFASPDELVVEAVRYWVERHKAEQWREYVREEVDWSRRVAGR